jgi:hypothetical protein
MKTKVIFALIAVLSVISTGLAQDANIARLRAYRYGYKLTGEDWKYMDCDILIIANFKESRITVYSQESQFYDVISVGDAYTDEDGDKIIKMVAVDEEGIECTLVLLNRGNGVLQLQALYSDVTWVYYYEDK